MRSAIPKRRRLTGDARREQILKVAARLFARHGFRGTSLRQLARAAAISEAMIYRHFPSKSALYDAMLERKIATVQSFAFPEPPAESREGRAALDAVVRNFLQRQSQDDSFMRMILFSALEGHEMARKFVQRPLRDFLQRLGDHLQTRLPSGGGNAPSGPLLARLLMGMAYYLALQREILKDPVARQFTIDEMTGAITQVFMRGIEAE
jgi:AcrR family transcriptional regulator